MVKATWLKMLLLVSLVGLTLVPLSYASYSCTVLIGKADYLETVSPGQSFSVITHVTATCTSQLSEPTSIRVDVIDENQLTLSSGVFNPGYAFAVFGGGTAVGTVANGITAPLNPGLWPLLIEASFFVGSDLMSTAQTQISIQVTGSVTSESLTSSSVIQNGGFEDGLANWQLKQGSSGYESISSSVTHSGSHSLAITLISPPPGSNAFAPSVVSVSQTVTVVNLRGLTILAWYATKIDSTLVGARVKVRVDGFTANYYVAVSPNTPVTAGDTPYSKSFVVSQRGCPTWCLLSRNVGSDFPSIIRPSELTSSITVSLELLGYGTMNDNQFAFWDDVQLDVQTPSTLTTTSIESTTATVSANTENTSTQTTSTSSEIAPSLSTQSGSTFSSVLSPTAAIAAAVVIVALALAYTVARSRKRKGAGNRERQFCVNCGAEVPKDSSFCNKCGASQGQKGEA